MIGTTIGETIDLELDLPPMLGTIEIDRGHLEQVMMNLAVNARDAMPGRGTLTIRCKNVEHAAQSFEGAEITLGRRGQRPVDQVVSRDVDRVHPVHRGRGRCPVGRHLRLPPRSPGVELPGIVEQRPEVLPDAVGGNQFLLAYEPVDPAGGPTINRGVEVVLGKRLEVSLGYV